jgi:DNA-binding PadR family transcriptional regulator
MSVQTQAVLAAFLREPSESRYGLELAREAGLAGGTLYPILARLEEAGWLESFWEEIDPGSAGRRPRRYYRLTGVGEREAPRVLQATIERLSPPHKRGANLAPQGL